jgi:hypothetical protein
MNGNASFARMFASSSNASETEKLLRPIHFETTTPSQQIDFKIVGVRDVEVEDYEYPTRIESEQKSSTTTPRVIRNPYASKNFISLWIDQLTLAENFLQKQKINYQNIQNEQGHQGLTISPEANENDELLFNLCDKPAFVELLQATPQILQDYQDELLEEKA